MKQHCGIPLQHFVMFGINEDGKVMRFTGPQEKSNPAVFDFFDMKSYEAWYNNGSMVPSRYHLPDLHW